MNNRRFWRRFEFALCGIRAAASSEASFKIQIAIGLAAAVVLAALRPPLLWVALCILAALAVLALELMNTALERLADRLHPETHVAIRTAKDCAAGAVLLASIAAVIIGALTVAVGLGWVKS
jgi:diacylglycerol kinase (ATP)